MSLDELKADAKGQRIIWFLTDLKTNDGITEEDINSQFSPKLIEKIGLKDLANMLTGLKTDQGYLNLYRARRKSDTEYKLLVQGANTDEWFDMAFYFEKENPNRIAGFTIDSNDAGSEGEPIFPLNN